MTTINRRDYLIRMGATAGGIAAASKFDLFAQEQRPLEESAPTTSTIADRNRRMQWWHEAKFGMFVHWGLYSVVGRHEWVMEMEGIPVKDYEPLAQQFNPKPNSARAWAQLARRAGMKYMVKLTKYCAPKQAAGRDLVREYVDAARAEGLRFGFYYSLMDWHHPDGARCLTDESARRRFVDYIHGQVSELMSNYGKVDILWYDVPWPLDAKGWESEEMNRMVRKLQPDIIINNRSKIPEDFDTPEQRIVASAERPWESCMTLNDSWGYHIADDGWKSPKTVIRNIITCAHDGGNYLLNIGPMGDGSIPLESVKILSSVGEWTSKNGESFYAANRCQPSRSRFASFSRKGNTLFMHVHYWPGETVVLGNLLNKVNAVRILAANQPVKFEQNEWRVRMTGLPKEAPALVTTIALECDGEPRQDHEKKRAEKPREGKY